MSVFTERIKFIISSVSDFNFAESPAQILIYDADGDCVKVISRKSKSDDDIAREILEFLLRFQFEIGFERGKSAVSKAIKDALNI